jgi:Dihydrofolate reductase
MRKSIIVAMDKNDLIGNDNELPWYLPADLKYFKEITMGKTVVMGRKTFESIGKPLPNRENIVLTRDKNLKIDGCIVINSKEELEKLNKDIFIIGGSEIFKIFLDDIDEIYVTKIEHEFFGNVYFPKINYNLFKETYNIKGTVDEKNIYNHTFLKYEKIK